MTRTTLTVTCPHCEGAFDIRLQTEADVAPSLKLPFTTAEEFARWLAASRMTIDEFKRLPLYEWHRNELEPFLQSLPGSVEDEPADQWHRAQLEPLTRGLTDEAHDDASPDPSRPEVPQQPH